MTKVKNINSFTFAEVLITLGGNRNCGSNDASAAHQKLSAQGA